MQVQNIESAPVARAQRLDTTSPYSDPCSLQRCCSLLQSLQRREPARRCEALGEHAGDKFTLNEIAQVRTLSERPSIATIARAVEACGLPIVLVWRDGQPELGVDFRGRRES